jgi:DNA-binding Lrp family transcriptional regulator
MRKGQKIKKFSLDSIDENIISELIKDANIGTSHLSRKFKVPLSTIQRRKRTLENSILNKKYEINHNELGWRAGDLIILVENGKTTEAMEHILKNHGDNNVISVSTKITPSTGA